MNAKIEVKELLEIKSLGKTDFKTISQANIRFFIHG